MVTADDIRAARRALNESQSAFGARLGVDQWTISRWETRGPPTRAFIQDGLARALDAMRAANPEAFASAPQVADGGGEGGGGEADHAGSVPQPDTEVSTNEAGGFA